MRSDLGTLSNVTPEETGIVSPRIGFAPFAFPEAKSSKTGVSVRYVPDPDKSWYVFRASYGREDKAFDILVEDGTYPYIAKQYVVKYRNGRRIKKMKSLIPNLIFVYTTRAKADEYVNKTPALSFLIYYLTAETKSEHLRFVDPSQCHYKGGESVIITDGMFKGVVGKVARVSGQQRVIVSITNVGLISTAYIPTAFIEKLPDRFPQAVASSKMNEKYKDYGTAVKKVSVKISAEELTACVRDHRAELPEGDGLPDIGGIVFEGRQDFEMLMTEEGKALKIRYGGKAGLSAEDLRTVRLDWKTVRSDSVDRDEMTLKTPDSAGTHRNNLILAHTRRKSEDGKETFQWKAETDEVSEGIRTRGVSECTAEAENGILAGNFVTTRTVRQNAEAMGSCAAEELARAVEAGEHYDCRRVLIPGTLIEGETVRRLDS